MEKRTDQALTCVLWYGLAIIGAVLAQLLLDAQCPWLGVSLYASSIGLWLSVPHPHIFLLRKPLEITDNHKMGPLSRLQKAGLLICFLTAGINLVAVWGRDTFTWVGIIAWSISLITFTVTFWKKKLCLSASECEITHKGLQITWRRLLFGVILLLGVGFRAGYLRQVPPEMTWDHTQKLLDIRDIVEEGVRPLFFYRNTGREPLQFYWTALLIRITQHPIDFTILKVGTVIAGLLTLPGIYLLARELFGCTVGLCAMGFAAVASWPVILSRTGLRYPFAPLFSAWAFYFLMRGWRKGEQESFLLLGACLGVGLYGYTAFRLIPFAVGCLWLLLNVAEKSGTLHENLKWCNFGLVVVMAILVFVPLGTFAITHAGAFWGRSAWYLKNTPSFAPLVYLNNVKNVFLMFNWRGDFMPLTTLPYEPVLDPILGGLFIIGVVITVRQIMSKEDSLVFALIFLGLFSLLPSALAINYPDENPSVVRTSCAIPIVYTITALPIGIWIESLSVIVNRKRLKAMICIILTCLILLLMKINAKRVFVDYPQAYRTIAPNTSEIANAIACFDALVGDLTDTYIIADPGWIDNDAMAFELGLPVWQNTIEVSDLVSRTIDPPQMYILHPGNTRALHALRSNFPTGIIHSYESLHDQDFVMYIVPSVDMLSIKVPVYQVARLTSACTRRR